jgi:hypothetical protein
VTHERHVVFQATAAADPHVWPHHAERPDFDVEIDLSSRINHGVVSNGSHVTFSVWDLKLGFFAGSFPSQRAMSDE